MLVGGRSLGPAPGVHPLVNQTARFPATGARACLGPAGMDIAKKTGTNDTTSPMPSFNERVWRSHLEAGESSSSLALTSLSAREGDRQAALAGGRDSAQDLNADTLWAKIQEEAAELSKSEPLIASKLGMTVVTHPSLSKSLAFLLSNKLANETLLGTQLVHLFMDAYADDAGLLASGVADLHAVMERDPACDTYVQCLLFYKGFQAVQSYRLGHWLWKKGRHTLALAIQSRMAEVFTVDIHPAARLGQGLLFDHATGIVIGETAVVGDNVSMLHHVTLGGSGTGRGRRHPTIGNGTLLGAGVSVLGPIIVGANCKIGAGSVVLTDLPPSTVAVGVPAKIIKQLDSSVLPRASMEQIADFILDWTI
ncbi:SAT1 [Auxenochlorella protothecoides x Auxenochlorella symbiontica]